MIQTIIKTENVHTLEEIKDSMILSVWSKTTLIGTCVGGAGEVPPTSKIGTFFLKLVVVTLVWVKLLQFLPVVLYYFQLRYQFLFHSVDDFGRRNPKLLNCLINQWSNLYCSSNAQAEIQIFNRL